MPLEFYRGYKYDKLANAAANMRAFTRMGWHPGDRLARVWAPHDHEARPSDLAGRIRRGLRRWLEGDVTFSAYESSPQDMERWIPRMRAFRPQFLYGYAANLTLFARFLQRRGVRVDGVRGIASTALALFPNDRKVLKEVFSGATVIDLYGSREITGIASECDLGTMHINSDLVHVEHLPVPDEPGARRLVITALDNTIFPFIRYDIGDYGAPSLTCCRCGLPFPAMQWGTGKVLDSFVSPEGRIMAGGFFEDLMYGSHGIHAYQFRQRSETEIVLFVVPAETFDDSARAHFGRVEAQIHSQFSSLVRLRVELVESIPLTPAGKHRFVVSDVRNPLSDDGDGGLPCVGAPAASPAAEKAVRV
jgi:phenylacetate-CoA ligase